jgi:hypothetical protein
MAKGLVFALELRDVGLGGCSDTGRYVEVNYRLERRYSRVPVNEILEVGAR